MKTRANWLLIPAVAIGLGACKKKEDVKAPDAPAAVATTPSNEAPAAVAEAVVPKLGAEERAAKLGFAKHLPQDTEAILSFYNGTKTANRVKGTKLWKLIQEQTGGLMGMPAGEPAAEDAEVPGPGQEPALPDDAAAQIPGTEAEEMGPAVLFGSEFTMALGKSTAEQVGNLLTVNRRLGYFQMRALVRAFGTAAKSGNTDSLEKSLSMEYGPELFKELLKDPQSGIALLEKSKLPPVYLAFRTKEADRPAAAQQIAALVANANMLEEVIEGVAEPVTIESAGQKLEGVKILGSKIAASMAEDREEMERQLDAATVDQLLAVVAKKDLVIVSGTVGDYVVLYLGGSVDDFKLAGDVSQSIVSSDALAFSDAYASKELAALSYGLKGSMETLVKSAGGFADITNGIRDGLAGSEGLGDTRDLEALLQIVAERETALRKLTAIESVCTVAHFEEGLKIESAGGIDAGMVDWKSPNKLARLGDPEDVFLFVNVTRNAAFDEKARAYYESLLETAYAMAMKVADVPMEGAEMAQFKEMAKLVDGKFRPDLVALWDAFGDDFGGSLGHESALVVDFKGGAPSVPGIPQKVLDNARVPRISIIAPVTDRAKLSGSWTKMNTTLTGTLAKISEMSGQEIPMQKPMSSERSGNTTWYFSMPFLTDDFVPSVTVGDKWFAASTSKNQALDLIAKADTGGETRTGFWLSLSFKNLEKYSNETLNLVNENAQAMMGSPLPEEQKALIQKSISILGDLDKLTVHSRREGAVLRSSVHFKTR
ncbi:MAG: hypothetical protein V4819_13730 [Verrucomicrobiota bacterium]